MRRDLVTALAALVLTLAAAGALAGCSRANGRGAVPDEEEQGQPRMSLAHPRRVPLPDGDWSVPVWHPDGDAIVVNRSEAGGGSQLWLVPLDASAPTQLTTGPGIHVTAYGRAWGPRGLLYSSDETGEQEIWLLDPVTFAPRKLGWTGGDNLAPSWSPDGRAFVFMRREYGMGRWELWVATPQGRLTRLQMSLDTTGDAAQAAWSPDGTRVLFQYGREAGWDLWMADVIGVIPKIRSRDPVDAGIIPVTVTPFVVLPGAQSDPTWAGEGRDVLFSYQTTTAATPELYIMASGVVQRLAGGKDPASMATASRDGKRVAYVKGIIGGRSIYVADLVLAKGGR